MSNITAKIIADSVNQFGNRLTTMVIGFPRYILAELNTHRAISKNSASSRAKPFKTMCKMVSEDPFIPSAWMKEHRGMQGTEYFSNQEDVDNLFMIWKDASEEALYKATQLNEAGLTKQLVNRVLEPFMPHEVIVSATDWENFFGLRCPQYEVHLTNVDTAWPHSVSVFRSRKDAIAVCPALETLTDLEWRKMNTGMADIHIMELAEAMWDAYNESQPVELQAGEWHMPYTDDIDYASFYRLLVQHAYILEEIPFNLNPPNIYDQLVPFLLKVSAARCARISYKTFGEDSKIDLIADIELHDRLLVSQPIHASPAEHQGQAMTLEDLDNNFVCEEGNVRLGVSRNFQGFRQYRTLLKGETIRLED